MNLIPFSARRRICLLLIALALLFSILLWNIPVAARVFGGALDPSFAPKPGLSESARAMIALPDGGMLVAGEFTSVNGVARGRIARLNADGTLDPTFAAGLGANGTIFALDRFPDGRLLIGGAFTAFDGDQRVRVARLNADGSLDTSFAPLGGPVADVRAIVALPDGGALIAGNFTSVGPHERGRIARLDPDGALDLSYAAGEGANGPIHALALQPDGTALIGGAFSIVDGTPRPSLASLDAFGNNDPTFDPGSGPNNAVRAIALLPDGGAYIGGSFTTVAGMMRNGLARIDAAGALVIGFAPEAGFGGAVYDLALQPDGALIVGGNVTLPGPGMRPGITRFTPTGAIDPLLNAVIAYGRTVYSVAVQSDGNVLISGDFLAVDEQIRHRIARLIGAPEPGGVRAIETERTVDEGIGAVTISLDRIGGADGAAGVTLTAIGGTADTLDYRGPIVGLPNGGSLRVNQVLPLPDGKTLIGGAFTSVDGIPRNRVARLNADGSLDRSFDPGLGADLIVETLAVLPDGRVLVAGQFTRFNGEPRSRIARLNADGSLDPTFVPPTIEGVIWELIVQPDDKLLIAGNITRVGNMNRRGIARLNADGSLDTSFVPAFIRSGSVAGMALQPDGKVVIGGLFDQIADVQQRNIARLNADGSLDTGFIPAAVTAIVREVALQPDGRILISGGFTQVGGEPRAYVARLNDDGSLDAGFAPAPGPNGWVLDVVPGPNGTVLISGEFTQVDGRVQGGIARLQADGSLDASFDPGRGADDWVYDLATLDDGKVLIGGFFAYVDTQRSVGFARLNADGSVDPAVRAQVTNAALVTWPHGTDGERTLTFWIIDDDLVEGDETLILELTPLQRTGIGAPTTIVITIRDNDGPTVTATPSPTVTATATSNPTATATASPTATATSNPTATATASPTATAIASPTATSSPTVTATSSPTATPTMTPLPSREQWRLWVPLVR